MTNKTISVIIPTYNMEGYLEKCLSSLVVPDRPGRVEAIVVNDGSKDSSLAIARAFEERHPDVFRVIDKPNGNYGSCINAALAVATGKYVKVLDADDCYDNGIFAEYVSLLDGTDADLVLNDRVNIFAGHEEHEAQAYPAGRVFDFFAESTYKAFRDVPMHCVAYRLSLVKDAGYRQTEGIFYTDNEWVFMPMAYVRTAFYFAKPLYRYLLAREGQSVDPAVQDARIGDEIRMTCSLIVAYGLIQQCPDKAKTLLYMRLRDRCSWYYKNIILKRPVLESNVLRPLDDALRDGLPELYRQVGRDTKYGIRYVSAWRRNESSCVIKMLRKVYRGFKKA